ncbi:MAG TPA: helix-turn-helix domain-containing protein, partial [Acidimicrobiia bacterium]|nr:helix-turn-helix domain-containing protein [Acidimicrobiia bacterium]
MYRERPSRVPGGFVWSSVYDGDQVRVLPDGCIDLLWDGIAVSIAGPDTHAQLYVGEPGSTMTGLRFAPGDAPRVLGVPAEDLTDQRVPLDAVWDPVRVRRFTDAVAAAPRPGTALETLALACRADPDEHSALIDAVVQLARGGCTSTTIADRIGLSARQLQRRSVAAFGYGTKTLGRILRMQEALTLIRRGEGLADSAARSGYADQSHLAREVKDLAGVTITQL